MPKYTNPEMRKSMQQMKEKPRKMKIISGSSFVRESIATPSASTKRARGSMASSGLPKSTTSTKKPATPMARATKRGTPVAMPKKAGNIASGIPSAARPLKTKVKATKKPTPKPSTKAQKEAAALDALMKKRLAEAKKTGIYPNYGTN